MENKEEGCLFIIRHGETEAKTNPLDLGGPLVSGHLDTKLTERGKQEIQEIGAQYKDVKFDLVFISPLMRSRESAEAFLDGANQKDLLTSLEINKNLIEINYGPHEGKSVEEVDRIKKDFFNSEEGKKIDGLKYSFSGNHEIYGKQESFYDGAERYIKQLLEIAKNNHGKNILIISHSGIMRAIQLCGKIKSTGAIIGQDLKFGQVIKLKLQGDSLELVN